MDTPPKRHCAVAALDGVAPATVPANALTTSVSRLAPDISPGYAYEQVARVARPGYVERMKAKRHMTTTETYRAAW
ncbi:potassium-transporting ATPase subunit C [Streptomyces syringium]|uniref:potassium-transporting ATPase subunit C n=1 Tax=Streptomyces syringium TaxID=76729 RepID=UPI0036B17EF3